MEESHAVPDAPDLPGTGPREVTPTGAASGHTPTGAAAGDTAAGDTGLTGAADTGATAAGAAVSGDVAVGATARHHRWLPLLVAATAALVVLLDQAAKAWAVSALGGGGTIEVIDGWVELRLYRNPGAAFSFATGTTWVFTIVATVVSVVIVRISRRLGSRGWALALGLLLGGAVGNLLDRLFRTPGFPQGHVVDFIDLPRLFVFNLADASITCAAVLIALLGLRGVGVDGTKVQA